MRVRHAPDIGRRPGSDNSGILRRADGPRRRCLIDEIETEIALGLLGQTDIATGKVLPFRRETLVVGRACMGPEAGGERAILVRRGHGVPSRVTNDSATLWLCVV